MKALLCAGFVFAVTNLFSQANFYQWSKQIGSSSNEKITSVLTDDAGNTYSYGYYYNPAGVDLDPGPGTFMGPAAPSNYLVKLDSLGNFVWARCFANSMSYGALGRGTISMDKWGNFYIIQGFRTTLDLDPGPGTQNKTPATDGSVFVLKLNSNGNFVWVKTFDAISTIQAPRGQDVAVDTLGNVYCVVSYRGTIDANPGAATTNHGAGSPNSIGSSFVTKLDSSGNFLWATNPGSYMGSTTSLYELKCIEVADNGNAYVAGDHWNTNSSATSEYYLIQLNGSNGAQTWARESSNTGIASLQDLALDGTGNVLITGNYLGTVNFSTTGTNNCTSAGSTDVYIVKHSAFGSFTWVRSMGGNLADYGNAIKGDSDGNVYCSGYFQSTTMDCDPGAGTQNLSQLGGMDAFVLSLDNAGDFRWAKAFGGAEDEEPAFMALDNGRNIFISGRFNGNCDFNPDAGVANLTTNGADDAFVMKLTNCIYNAPDICLVSVDSMANNNVIYWDEDQYPLADSFIVYRYDALSTNFLRIGAVAKSNPDNFLVDTARTTGGPNGGDPQYSSYRYKLAIRGVCGDLGTMGLYHESIFIQQNFQNFNWNAYAIEGQPSPATGYQFLRDNNNTGSWQVLVNTGGLSTTDPNYASYPNGNWRVDALGFSCSSDGSSKLIHTGGPNQVAGAINTSRSNIKSPTSVGLQEPAKALPLKIYPNPVSDQLTLEFPSMSEEVLIEMQNILGEVVYAQRTNQLKNVISCAGMGPGIYFITVSSSKRQSIRKVVVQ